MSEPAISAKNVGIFYPAAASLKKTYKKGFWALQDVSFEINKGDILGVIGSNGAGKSTLLSVISGIMAPDNGTVNTYNHSAMLLSLNAGLSPQLSGRKNIFLTGLTLGMDKNLINQRMEEIIQFSDLGDFIEKPVATYSTGMRSRLGFSTALYLEPDIFLIDEALGVGDRDFKKKSSDALKLKLSKNVTAVIVSHSEKTIKELCNKALFLERGKSVVFGTPAEVFKVYNKEV